MADYASNIYQNHCVPSGNNNIVIQCEDCLEETTPGTFEPVQNACGTKNEHGVDESLIAEISTQKYFVPINLASTPAPQLRSVGQPFFDIERQETPGSVWGFFRFDNTSVRTQALKQVNAVKILGEDYVQNKVVNGATYFANYQMSWFNCEMFFDVVGSKDNEFIVEVSLCGQHETAGGSSLYQTIAQEASSGSSEGGTYARLSIILARNLLDNGGNTRVTTGAGSWETTMSPPYYSGPRAYHIVDPVNDGRHKPVMLFGRVNQVWKIRVSAVTADGDPTANNDWRFKMYLLDANGNRL